MHACISISTNNLPLRQARRLTPSRSLSRAVPPIGTPLDPVSLYLSIYLSIYLLSIYLSIYVCMYLYIYCLSIYVRMYVCMYLYIYNNLHLR